jgi:hypothetical protein
VGALIGIGRECVSNEWATMTEQEQAAARQERLNEPGSEPPCPFCQKAKSKAKRLHPVQPVRSELAGGGGLEPKPEGRAVGEVLSRCPVDPKHLFFRNGAEFWCSGCKRAY